MTFPVYHSLLTRTSTSKPLSGEKKKWVEIALSFLSFLFPVVQMLHGRTVQSFISPFWALLASISGSGSGDFSATCKNKFTIITEVRDTLFTGKREFICIPVNENKGVQVWSQAPSESGMLRSEKKIRLVEHH